MYLYDLHSQKKRWHSSRKKNIWKFLEFRSKAKRGLLHSLCVSMNCECSLLFGRVRQKFELHFRAKAPKRKLYKLFSLLQLGNFFQRAGFPGKNPNLFSPEKFLRRGMQTRMASEFFAISGEKSGIKRWRWSCEKTLVFFEATTYEQANGNNFPRRQVFFRP